MVVYSSDHRLRYDRASGSRACQSQRLYGSADGIRMQGAQRGHMLLGHHHSRGKLEPEQSLQHQLHKSRSVHTSVQWCNQFGC